MERDLGAIVHYLKMRQFQLTRSRGAWRWKRQLETDKRAISTHTLTWSVTVFFFKCVGTYKFQLTRSRGAWPDSWEYGSAMQNFNSHAHVERDAVYLYDEWTFWFQLTRSRGAWHWILWTVSHPIYFNSHAHVERDWNSFRWDYIPMIISTHTLTWSVTYHGCRHCNSL